MSFFILFDCTASVRLVSHPLNLGYHQAMNNVIINEKPSLLTNNVCFCSRILIEFTVI